MNLLPHEVFIQRCFDLAKLGAGATSPNPIVGAVLVHKGKIIGEGYHSYFGGPHAEVNAINSVTQKDKTHIGNATLYVSLEPCCFAGKTPACTNLIIQHQIPRVVVACKDPFPRVNGKGIDMLRSAGIEVIEGVLEEAGNRLIKPFITTSTKKRPHIILKFARSKNGVIGIKDHQIKISNFFSSRLVHKWRSEIDAILIGSRTALTDNPSLTNRYYFGKSPLRICMDRNNRIHPELNIWQDAFPTLVVGKNDQLVSKGNKTYLPFDFHKTNAERELMELLFEQFNIGILMIEGGAIILKRFIDLGLWDEALQITGSRRVRNADAIYAPEIFQDADQIFPVDDNILETFIHKC